MQRNVITYSDEFLGIRVTFRVEPGLGLGFRVGLGSGVRVEFRVRFRIRVRVGFRAVLGLNLVQGCPVPSDYIFSIIFDKNCQNKCRKTFFKKKSISSIF